MIPSQARMKMIKTLNLNFSNILKFTNNIVKLGSRSKVYLKSQIRDLDLELDSIIAMSPTTRSGQIVKH